MNGNSRYQPGSNRAQRLAYGNIRLIDPHYLALAFGVVMVGYNSVKHRVAYAVKEAVDEDKNGESN